MAFLLTADAHSGIVDAMATLRADDPTPQARPDADYLHDSALRTLKTVAAAGEDRLTYIRRFKGKQTHTRDEKTQSWSASSSNTNFFDTAVAERGPNSVDDLLAAPDDKRFEVNILQAANAHASHAFKASGGGGGGGAGGGGGGSCASTNTDNMTEKDRKARGRKKRDEADRKKAAKLHTDRRRAGLRPRPRRKPTDRVRRRTE
eukprot:jgi/Tetstr1/422759/TSEL_013556.t1